MYKEIPIKDVKIPRGRRALMDIEVLSESIKQHGLLNPITVTETLRLVAGLHRLKACESLGWETIPAIIMALDEVDAALVEVDENLIRHEPSALERCELLDRRKRLYEAKYPYTRHGAHKRSKGQAQVGDTKVVQPSFASNTAKRIKLSKRTIQQDISISRNLNPVAKETIRNTPLANRTNDLVKLSKLPSEEQVKVAEMAAAKPEVKFRKLLKARALESAQAQVKNQVVNPTIHKSEPLPFLDTIRPHSIESLITAPPCNVDDLPRFVRTFLPMALSKVKDSGQAYIIVPAEPEVLRTYLDNLAHSPRLVLANILVQTGLNTSQVTPKQAYKNDWKAVLYLRGPEARHLDCSIPEEQLDVQHARNKKELIERFIRHSSYPTDTVLDLFAGNGTILQAALRLGREALGCENNEEALQAAEQAGCKVIRN